MALLDTARSPNFVDSAFEVALWHRRKWRVHDDKHLLQEHPPHPFSNELFNVAASIYFASVDDVSPVQGIGRSEPHTGPQLAQFFVQGLERHLVTASGHQIAFRPSKPSIRRSR